MTRGVVDRALAKAITHLDAREHCDVTLFDGTARFDPVLVGPPGRLHGGLHLAARTFAVLAALDPKGGTPRRAMHLDVALGKAIPLDEDVTFDGALVRSGEDLSLETRFLGSGRLTATARALPTFAMPSDYGDGLEEALRDAARTQRIFGVPFRVTERVVYVELGTDCHVEGFDFTRYLLPDGGLGATWLCAALDTIAAVGLGLAWDTHLFTTRAVIETSPLPFAHDTALVAITRLDRARPVEGSPIPKVVVRGEALGTTRLPVVLARRADLSPLAYGEFDLHPVDLTRFATRTASPAEL